jgi:hypothetical protein
MTLDLNLGDTRLIIEECRVQGCTRAQAAYILATAKWETAHTMKPVRETLADNDAQAVGRLDHAWKKGQLPWVSTPYWRTGWFGRGYVQLTHRGNYVKAGDKLGVDLVADPSAALRPEVAAPVLVKGMMEGWFTGRALTKYINADRADLHEARRVVNGTDRAKEIAAIAVEYDEALNAEGYGVEPTVNTSPERVNETPKSERIGWGAIIKAILSIFTGGRS